MLNDFENAIPLNIKLDMKASGQPWKIQINNSKTYALPTELADTDYLYNLDDVIVYPDKDELIDKLKSMVPSDIFRKGMDGYSGGKTSVNIGFADTDQAPATFENPISTPTPVPAQKSGNIPKANVSPTMSIPKANTVKAPVESDIPEAPSFSAPSNIAALTAAAAYLRKK